MMSESPSESAAAGVAADAVMDRVIRLARSLQAAGHPVALAEVIDAAEASRAIGLEDRELFRVCLRSTLVKHDRSIPQFDRLFDRLFPARPARDSTSASTTASTAASTSPAAQLADGTNLGQLATELVDAHAGLDGDIRSEGHHLQRAYRAADLARLMSEARKQDPSLSAEELRARVAELKRLIADDIHNQIGDSGDDLATADLEDIEFLRASRAELDQMRSAIAPLARRIASRLARRRQSVRPGKVDLRRTARRSTSSGGVPIDLAHRRPRPRRPELFVLCDVSGSVADFSVFILTLVASLAAELKSTRSFVFVDAVDEITSLLDGANGIEPWQIMRNTDVIGVDGHSNYEAALEQFWEQYGNAYLRGSSTVLICGDGRTNYRGSGVSVIDEIRRRVRRVYWFNPEPEQLWDTDDSAMERYREVCAGVFEVRTLRQLAVAVENII